MCGLFVSIGFAPDRRHIEAVQHRGPDGTGWREFDSRAGPLALGHRRLSIIDLDDRALQPMASADQRHWLTYNGEIYNYLELRRELQALGCRFRTESDAEVLLEAYRVWGEGALDRLIGMFAFAIWDTQAQTLFIARDRLGIKPLFYHAAANGIAFASEIKQLLGLPGFSRRIDLARAHDFLSAGVTDHTASTLFADAHSLGPGRCVKLDLSRWRPGAPLPVRNYWTPPGPGTQRFTENDAAGQFRALFSDSVRLQMRSDVRVGSCLSGGLDSSAIVCTQARDWPAGAERLNAISAVFPGTSVDESPFIDAVIAKTGARSIRVTCTPQELLADTEAVLRAQDEPYGSTSLHAQYRVFKAAREHGVKVMLDGQGADEILGGYHGCFHFHYARLIRQARLLPLLKTLSERKAWHGLSFRDQLAPYLSRLPLGIGGLFTSPAAPAPADWLGTALMRRHAPPGGNLVAQVLDAEGMAPIRSLGDYCVLLTRATSLPMLLRYEDRNSMAHGIEARVPFLDHRLVEFALSLGDQHKIEGGDTKRVLRLATKDVLPPEVADRRDKIGFATPEADWMRGPLRAGIVSGIEDTVRLYPEIFDADAVKALVKNRLEGSGPADFSLWRIFIFGAWGRMHGMTH